MLSYFNRSGIIIFLLCSLSKVFSQFNFQVGYNYNWSDFSTINSISKDFNSNHSDLSKSLKELHALHGIYLGFRYQFDHLALVANWSNQISSRYYIQPPASSTDSEFKRQFFFKNQLYALGFESVAGNFAFGTTVDFRNFSIKARDKADSDKYTLLTNENFGSTFYTQFDYPVSSRMALILRIHYSLPWKNVEVSELNSLLNPQNTTSTLEKFRQFGLSLIFSNGFQPRY